MDELEDERMEGGREEPFPPRSGGLAGTSGMEGDIRDRADMVRLVSGEDAALEALMERHGIRVFNFLNRLLGDAADAEDLTQETFARLYRARGRFNRRQRLSAWLYTIAANLARNRFRWRARHPEVSLDDRMGEGVAGSRAGLAGAGGIGGPGSVTPAADLLAAERRAAVRAAVAALPEALREVVVLCEWEEMSAADAAAVLGITGRAVESKLYRARQQLRELLRDWL